MFNYMQNEKDPHMWELAQSRASFKYHIVTYILVNSFLWVMWFLNGKHYTGNGFPWPVWPMMGWGIGMLFHFLGAYVFPKQRIVEQEYQRLTRNRS